MTIREIHTTFYSDYASNVLKAALLNISNSNANGKTRRVARYAKVNKHPNGEVLISISDSIYNWQLPKYIQSNDIDARAWLAWQIKELVKYELSKTGNADGWKRNNTTTVKLLSDDNQTITVHDAYCIYDLLKARKNVEKYYQMSLIETIRGTENDPFKTEMEVQRRNELKLITDEYQKKIDAVNINSYYSDIYKRMSDEVSEIRKRYMVESHKLTTELRAERDSKIKALDEQFSILNAI